MSTIKSPSSYATLINVFHVDPARAQELVDLLVDATDSVMQHLPGFKSASIHRSADDTRVVNYAQWVSAEAFQAMLQNPAAQVHMGKSAELAISFDPKLYTVESVHDL